MTKGEYRVGTNFNPSNDDLVSRIKSGAAALIDLMNMIPGVDSASAERAAEIGRCKALAMTGVEEAAMWAVKAATKPEPKE